MWTITNVVCTDLLLIYLLAKILIMKVLHWFVPFNPIFSVFRFCLSLQGVSQEQNFFFIRDELLVRKLTLECALGMFLMVPLSKEQPFLTSICLSTMAEQASLTVAHLLLMIMLTSKFGIVWF